MTPSKSVWTGSLRLFLQGLHAHSLSLRRHAHGPLAKRLMHMVHFGPVPNGTLNPRGLSLSLHFCDVMPLWLSGRSMLRSSPQFRLGRSADRRRTTAVSTLLNAKMRNGTPYGLCGLNGHAHAAAIVRPHPKCPKCPWSVSCPKCPWSVPFGTGPSSRCQIG